MHHKSRPAIRAELLAAQSDLGDVSNDEKVGDLDSVLDADDGDDVDAPSPRLPSPSQLT